jgi:hypothetical protein
VTAVASIVVALIALAGTVVMAIQNRRGTDKTTGLTERAQVFAELQALKDDLHEARKQCSDLERRIRSATDYIDTCMADYRTRGVEPPPIKDRPRAPWEG